MSPYHFNGQVRIKWGRVILDLAIAALVIASLLVGLGWLGIANHDADAEAYTDAQIKALGQEARAKNEAAERSKPPIHLSMPLANLCSIEVNSKKEICR